MSRFDGLDALLADVTHPQCQSVTTQEQIVGIEINRDLGLNRWIVKDGRKVRV